MEENPGREQIPFVSGVNVGDIVAINGKPAKGIWSSTYTHTTAYRVAPQPGQFIADVDTGATFYCTWQIFAPDGTFLGRTWFATESRRTCSRRRRRQL